MLERYNITVKELPRILKNDPAISDIKIEDIGIGWLHLATELPKEERGEIEEGDWYVAYKEESPYEVWILNI